MCVYFLVCLLFVVLFACCLFVCFVAMAVVKCIFEFITKLVSINKVLSERERDVCVCLLSC